MPIVYAFEKASKKEKKLLTEIYRKNVLKERDINLVLSVLENVKAHDYSEKMAKKFETKALEEFSTLKIRNDAMEKLKSLTEFLVRRKY